MGGNMRLRNKKTGEIIEIDNIRFVFNDGYAPFSSLRILNAYWEDYTQAEPLIKDEKIRKAVRAWAEAADTEYLAFEDYDDENVYFIDRDFEPQIWFPKKSILGSPLDDGKIYTIAELCGEEEE